MPRPNNQQEDELSTSSASSLEFPILLNPATYTSDTNYTQTASQPHDQSGLSGFRRYVGSSSTNESTASSLSTLGSTDMNDTAENIRISQSFDQPGPSDLNRRVFYTMTRPNDQQEDELSTSSASSLEFPILLNPATYTSDTNYTQTTSQPHDQSGPLGFRRYVGSSSSTNESTASTDMNDTAENIRISQSFDQPGPSGLNRRVFYTMTRPNYQQEDELSTSSASSLEFPILLYPATYTSDTNYTQTTSQLHDQPGPSGVRRNAGSSASINQGATSTSAAPRRNVNRVERENILISQSHDQPGPSGVRRNAGSSASTNQSAISTDMNDTAENIRISQSFDQPGPSGLNRRTTARYPAVPTHLIDCRYYRENRCNRGNYCRFRHQPASLGCEEICQDFIQGRCLDVRCHLRHDESRRNEETNLGTILCKVEKEKIGSCSKVGCPYYHRDLNSFANQAKALFFIRNPLTVEVDGPPLQQFPHDAYHGSIRCFWEHLPSGCRRENCTFIHENGPFSLSMRRYFLLQIVPRSWWQHPDGLTVQMWHNSPSHIYSVEQWVWNVSTGHHVAMVVRCRSCDTTTTWTACCPSSISEQPPWNWPLHYISWEWVLGAASAHWTPEYGLPGIDPETGGVNQQWDSASERQSPPQQINPQWESLRWPPMEINPEWSTSVTYSRWTTSSVQQFSRWPPQQIYPQRPPQQIYPQRPPQQIYLQRPPQQIYQQRPPQIYSQRPPQQIYSSRPPQQINPQMPPQQFYPQMPPQQINPQMPPQQFYPQRSPQQFYQQRLPHHFYLQRSPQQFYPQRPPQQIHPQRTPQQFNPQRLPQPINPQWQAGAVNAQWSSAYMQQSSLWSLQPIYPQQPPQHINTQWSWGWQQVAMAAGWQTAQYSYYIDPWSQNILLRSAAHYHPNVHFVHYADSSGYFVDLQGNYAGVPYNYPYQMDDRS